MDILVFQSMLAISPLRKVFLFAYMRGGSTLLYETFNHDTRAVAWYEPLSTFYGHYYGLPLYRTPNQLVFNRSGSGQKLRYIIFLKFQNNKTEQFQHSYNKNK